MSATATHFHAAHRACVRGKRVVQHVPPGLRHGPCTRCAQHDVSKFSVEGDSRAGSGIVETLSGLHLNPPPPRAHRKKMSKPPALNQRLGLRPPHSSYNTSRYTSSGDRIGREWTRASTLPPPLQSPPPCKVPPPRDTVTSIFF